MCRAWNAVLDLSVGVFCRYCGMALTAAIMFCVAAVMFTMYAELCIPEIIFGFIGYVRIGKILNEENGGIQS